MARFFKNLFGTKTITTDNARKSVFRPGIEALEDRRLLAINLVGSTLEVTGTSAADNVTIQEYTSNVVGVIMRTAGSNDQFWFGQKSQVTSFKVSGMEGDDEITNLTDLPSTLLGGHGNDKLVGGSAADRIEGGEGDDRLDGRAGSDTYAFGPDVYFNFGTPISFLGRDRVIEAANLDSDTLDFSAMPSGVVIDLARLSSQVIEAPSQVGHPSYPQQAPGFSLTLSDAEGIEDVIGTAYDDVLRGNERGNRLWGKDGGDELYGRGGQDTLLGGLGGDTLDGGNDRLRDFLYGNEIAPYGNLGTTDGAMDFFVQYQHEGANQETIYGFEKGDVVDVRLILA